MRRFRGQNRRTKRPHNGIRLPRNAPEIELEIERTGARGDGIGTARYTLNYETRDWPVFVAGTLAGERVRVRPTAATAQGITAEIIELIRPSPDRGEPVCNVFRGGRAVAAVRFSICQRRPIAGPRQTPLPGCWTKPGCRPISCRRSGQRWPGAGAQSWPTGAQQTASSPVLPAAPASLSIRWRAAVSSARP